MTKNQQDAAVIADCVVRAVALITMYDNETLSIAAKLLSRNLGCDTPEEQAVIDAALALIARNIEGGN